MIVNNKHNNVCIPFRNFGCEQISFVKSKDAPRLILLISARGNEKFRRSYSALRLHEHFSGMRCLSALMT